ncbi:MAG: bifunctional diaminohydroxyphosphoribosylaminopyrimidine deaminase/5-amino-6-(5-phosphoribosylamino)uracil reductase RibD [Candidatus Daviesbacteria bacterium]|nr:bifunctional diaminohydroxyphosphoribosylaminopyrimidine deaminase/5-amino-6-(5-phosphoribosylamino)uracil reductase RibD [Candidatus Daviesbacteria bacterium]
MNNDIKFLKETLELAKKGLGWTNPNPMVGAIIVKNGRVIGQGFHRKVGLAHAEVEALNAATENPKGATMYVSLEPCAIFGRTPPCTDTIIKSGIEKVVCASLDPNQKIHGKGIAKLKKAGIETSVGRLEQDVRKLNEAFFTFHEKKRPFVAIKFATSLDGKMATRAGDSKWITNEKTRRFARGLRAGYQGLVIGINTVLADNPNLGAKLKGKKDPIRIILDPKLQIPLNADVLRDTNVIIVTTAKGDKQKRKKLESKGFTILTFNEEHITIPKLLSVLREKEIISILVEGGGETLGNFIDAKIIDKVYTFHAPVIIGGRKAICIGGKGVETVKKAVRLKNVTLKKFDDNLLITGYPE